MERITIGSGKLYIAEFENTIPEDIEIEKETNLLGYIQGGATLVYSPSFYEAKDDLGIVSKKMIATVYKGNIIKNLIMDCQSYTKYRPNETTGGIFVSWRRKEELPTGA